MTDYLSFLKGKEITDTPTGFEVGSLNPALFDWQIVLVRWALMRGRAAIFADCGLGKTIMQLVWAEEVLKHAGGPVLIFAPLAVAEQTRAEGKRFGIDVHIAGSKDGIRKNVINISNYEKLHKFDPSVFTGIILDESSILKHHGAATRTALIDAFCRTPYRLACTATPAPNDWMELGNHAEFLGVMTRPEMLSTFFINDSGDTGKWRLKGHVKDNFFWKWLSSWAVMMSFPSDLGFGDDGFILPAITYHEHVIKAKGRPTFGLLNMPVSDLNSRRRVRKETLDARCREAADLINSGNDAWVIWCNLNAEGERLTGLIRGAVEVAGRHSDELKTSRMLGFAEGKIRRLVTKPRIAGHGMNWQACHKVAFVGLSDSWEDFYQATRRVWRFGQAEPVEIHIFIEEREGPVLKNIKTKDENAQKMIRAMVNHMKELTKREIKKSTRVFVEYNPTEEMRLPVWLTS